MPDALAPKLVTNPDKNAVVKCRACGESKETRQMPGHLGKKHKGLKIADYVEKYGQEAGQDFWFWRRGSAGHAPEESTSEEFAADEPATLEEDSTKSLTAFEQKFYDDYTQEIFGQIDRDVSQWPIVMSLAMDMISSNRLRQRLDGIADEISDSKVIDALVRQHKYTEERIRMHMKTLGIAREDKLKNRAQIRSTPFSLISGYMDELERMTPQQLQALENEERKLLAEVQAHIKKTYLDVAPDLEEAEEDHESVSKLDVDDLIAKSGVQL